jgi:hypothetical protein
MKEDQRSTLPSRMELAGFLLALLLSITAVIALVWLGVDFGDRADLPNYWNRALVTIPLALAFLGAAAWLVRKVQVMDPRPSPPPPTIATWWWPFYTQTFGVIIMVQIIHDFPEWHTTVAGSLSAFVILALGGGMLLLTRDGVRSWQRSSRAGEEIIGWRFALFLFTFGLFNLRHSLDRVFWIGLAIALLLAIPLAGYMYTNRTPRLPPIGKGAS